MNHRRLPHLGTSCDDDTVISLSYYTGGLLIGGTGAPFVCITHVRAFELRGVFHIHDSRLHNLREPRLFGEGFEIERLVWLDPHYKLVPWDISALVHQFVIPALFARRKRA